MISGKLKALVDRYSGQGKMKYYEGAAEDQISKFEKEHGISLPDGYKEWLQFSDGGFLFLPAGIQLRGLIHKPVIDVNAADRPNDNYIVIGALANGDPILCEKSGEQISIFNLEAGRIEPDETYPDFHAFIGDLENILGLGD